MARILVYYPDECHARSLVAELKPRRFYLEAFHDSEELLVRLKQRGSEFDILILGMTNDGQRELQLLDACCEEKMDSAPNLNILCVSRIYHGPHLRLEVERRGARLVYER